ncbi:MAG: hypothetical protein J5796_04565, partial [Erysipelotrichaceae bacterium]|nr:hypothetical protein [Erysipelotrichaceae bacterium]
EDEYKKQRETIRQTMVKMLEELKAEMAYTDLFSLWKTTYSWIVVSCKGYPKHLLICENKNRTGEMETGGFSIPPSIVSRDAEIKNNRLTWSWNTKLIHPSDAEKPIWKLFYAQEKAVQE